MTTYIDLIVEFDLSWQLLCNQMAGILPWGSTSKSMNIIIYQYFMTESIMLHSSWFMRHPSCFILHDSCVTLHASFFMIHASPFMPGWYLPQSLPLSPRCIASHWYCCVFARSTAVFEANTLVKRCQVYLSAMLNNMLIFSKQDYNKVAPSPNNNLECLYKSSSRDLMGRYVYAARSVQRLALFNGLYSASP
jgi:hypothetical protein